jgi:hypothetical protein
MHDLFQLHAEHQHLRHAVRHVRLGGHDARGVEVGADDVGREALAHGAIGNRPQEAAAAVAQVEEHAALARLVHERLDRVGPPVEQLDVAIVVEVRVQIARPHLLEHLGAGVAPGPAQDVVVEDDRAVRQAPSLDRALDRDEPLAAEVRVLDADDLIRVFQELLRRGLRIHVGDVVLVAAHAKADDVDERQYPRLRPPQDFLAVIVEVAPARAARIHHRRRSRGQRHVVWKQRAAVAVVMAVDVDQAGDDVEARHVDDPLR